MTAIPLHRLPIAVLALLALPPPGAAQVPRELAARHVEQHGAALLAEFFELLELPNVAGDTEGIAANAAWLVDALSRRGVEADILTLPGASPLVVGSLRTEGASRTLGVYIHYDGQPVDRARWSSPPWAPVLFDAAREQDGQPRALPEPGEPWGPEWRVYARSAGDDKAPVIAWLAALDALAAADRSPSVDLVFLLEGEEEAGSPHLADYLDQHRDRLAADVWLFCDGPVHASGRPQLAFGVRGITSLEITLYGAVRPLHSGHYGNWAPNPALALAHLLAGMKEGDGRVLIDGFYDDVVPLGPGERAALAALPEDEQELAARLGLAATEAEGRLFERLALPSLNIRGMAAARVGEAARNLIPHEATASLDVRLVAGNRPEAMLALVERHIASQGYHIVRETPDAALRLEHPALARVVRQRGYPAARTALDDPAVRPIVARTREVAGDELVLLPSLGGSLPLHLFTEGLGRPTIIVPIANADNNQHAPDENLRLGNLLYGIELAIALLTVTG